MKAMKNLMLASLLIGLGACSNHEQDVLETSKCITVDAGFGTDSRVATNGLVSVFEENDAIGVYAWTGGSALPDSEAGFQVYNVENEFDGTNWNADEQMLWKDGATKHYFLGVYPPTDILTTKTYTIDPADQTRSDLLIAINLGQDGEGIAPQGNPVSLAFDHVMAKLRVNIQFNDEFAGTTPAVSSVTAEAKKTADIDWVTATATAKGDNAGVQLQSGTVAYSYESVMVPQNGFAGVAMVIDGETYTFTNTQDIQLKKGTITTLSLTVGRSAVEVGDITINDWTDGEAIAGYLKNIDEQIAAIQASVSELINVDATLQNLIDDLEREAADLQTQLDSNAAADAATKQALEAKITTIEALIATLQAKDAELDQQIANLMTYVDDEITATENWADATFATLTQYTDLKTDVDEISQLIEENEAAITDITNTVTDMQTAIATLETSMQTWVSQQLQEPLADIATLQADLTNLSNSVATDAELTAAIAEQQTALDNAMNGVSQTIREAITAAIGNDGTIDLAISQKIDAAKTELQSQISTINSAITTIQDRLDKLEKRIQSIRFLPEYSDGKVKIEPGMSAVELTFIVSPKEAAAIAADKVTAFIYHTQSRAVDAVPLTVTGVSGDIATGMLTVSVTPPAETYWATGITANIYVQINDGNNDIISEMIPAFYYVEPDYVTFSAGSVQTFSWAKLMPMSARTSRTTTNGTFEYSVGGGEWKALAENQTVTFGGTNGDLRLRGIAPEGTNGKIIAFGNETLVACSGDIRTLVDWENHTGANTENAVFADLFNNCTQLTSAPALPATTLAEDCYFSMFEGCINLTSAPALPATILSEYCYYKMFYGCTNLKTPPTLSTTQLAECCYSRMFYGCLSLSTAPVLPATELAVGCYEAMFYGCTSLTAAPELKATTLVESCYCMMFQGCSNLSSVTMLATEGFDEEYCLYSWLSEVNPTGTFTRAEGMESIPTNSTSGIPTGWTVKVKSVEQEQETLPGFNYVNGY